MPLYLLLILCTIAIPLFLSFDKKLRFYSQWSYLLPSILIVAILFIIIDIYFTRSGIWGFNEQYHSNILWLSLPLEEWLFFIVVPYASIFLHDSVVLYFKRFSLSKKTSTTITVLLLIFTVIVLFFNAEKAYTFFISTTVCIVLILSFFDSAKTTRSFYLTFLIMLIPFIAINATLTGFFTKEAIVWYNSNENMGIRFLTIPCEDFAYAFCLILFNILLRSKIKEIFNKKSSL